MDKKDIKAIEITKKDGTVESWQVVKKQKGKGDQLIIQRKKNLKTALFEVNFEITFDADKETLEQAVNRAIKKYVYGKNKIAYSDVNVWEYGDADAINENYGESDKPLPRIKDNCSSETENDAEKPWDYGKHFEE